ncbi:hypothetical protein TorRG33x02_168360 [Trema orientale]|uniref:Uncharacterized protein n=1 Tax=Trema orientale TaxID=63057 RepID=A0A2P5EP77_TREOI|nr:hypothetical protein TorRG33x02_168360 [Trema orientale]
MTARIRTRRNRSSPTTAPFRRRVEISPNLKGSKLSSVPSRSRRHLQYFQLHPALLSPYFTIFSDKHDIRPMPKLGISIIDLSKEVELCSVLVSEKVSLQTLLPSLKEYCFLYLRDSFRTIFSDRTCQKTFLMLTSSVVEQRILQLQCLTKSTSNILRTKSM